jgi:ubiquinone/menaquinone biosynthesis C-methylase UbiE
VNKHRYIDFLAKLAVDNAHPGGHQLTKAIIEQLPIKKGSGVLDVGCGTGATAVFLSEHLEADVTGIDLHPRMVERAKERVKACDKPAKIIQASAEQLPFQTDTFDCLLSESVTAFTDVERSAPEYFRVLRPGGHLMAIEMTIEHPIDKRDQQLIQSVYGVNSLYTEENWLEIWKRAGFTQVTVLPVSQFRNVTGDALPTYNFTSEIDEETLEVWLEHMHTMQTYKNILSYRIFHAIKTNAD